jgi:hypothetical protein
MQLFSAEIGYQLLKNSNIKLDDALNLQQSEQLLIIGITGMELPPREHPYVFACKKENAKQVTSK